MLPKFLPSDRRFLRLDDSEADPSSARIVILPVPYERTTTFVKGTVRGPAAILHASGEVELFDEELSSEPFRRGIATVEPLEPRSRDLADAVAEIEAGVAALIGEEGQGRCVVTLGGEHTVSVGAVRAFADRFSDLAVVQLDAHGDLRDRYLGTPYNHACAMRRIAERLPNILPLGIRNISAEEADYIKSKDVPVFYAREMVGRTDWIDAAMDLLPRRVYLTIDLDYFDPSIMPAVGTPEPGGLGWYETLEFLRRLASSRDLVGFDVVELCPIPGQAAPDFLAARLVYKILAYLDQRWSADRAEG